MRFISDLTRAEIVPGLKLISSLGTAGVITKITTDEDFEPDSYAEYATVNWDNGKESLLAMKQIRTYNKVQVAEEV